MKLLVRSTSYDHVDKELEMVGKDGSRVTLPGSAQISVTMVNLQDQEITVPMLASKLAEYMRMGYIIWEVEYEQ